VKTYTKDEAAKYLKISVTSMDDLIATGSIPAGKIGKQVILCEPDLDEYLIGIIREQTEQRRDAFKSGRKVHITTAVSDIRKSRKDKPVLPALKAA
jgi:excisionase family DNA binding protein